MIGSSRHRSSGFSHRSLPGSCPAGNCRRAPPRPATLYVCHRAPFFANTSRADSDGGYTIDGHATGFIPGRSRCPSDPAAVTRSCAAAAIEKSIARACDFTDSPGHFPSGHGVGAHDHLPSGLQATALGLSNARDPQSGRQIPPRHSPDLARHVARLESAGAHGAISPFSRRRRPTVVTIARARSAAFACCTSSRAFHSSPFAATSAW